MFYYLSKIFWLFIDPLNLSLILLGLGLLFLLLAWRRSGFIAVALGFAILALCSWTSFGAVILHPLEDRFARPATMPDRIDGIVVLGGGFEGGINAARGGYELNDAGDRIVAAAALARRYIGAKVLVSGGNGSLLFSGEGDADTAPRLLTALGVSADRILTENRSRNTYENARFSADLIKPGPDETWLLVTSAFHMPRAMDLFRKAGFPVIAWPTDYRTRGRREVSAWPPTTPMIRSATPLWRFENGSV